MADLHDTAAHDHVHGQMEITEQAATWDLFMFMTKWGSLATAAIVLFLTVWFAVGAGFLAAAISAGALSVIGFFALKSKPAQH